MSSYTMPSPFLGTASYPGDVDIVAIAGNENGTGSLNIQNGNLGVFGIAQLKTTNIVTATGGTQNLTVSGTGSIVSSVGGSSSFTSAGASTLTSSGGTTTLSATSTSVGIVNILGSGLQGSNGSIFASAPNTTSGQITLNAAGNIATAINIIASSATAGGILMSGTGLVSMQTTNTTSGIVVGTATAGIPITIGSSSSIITLNGRLIAPGGLTQINTTSFDVKDNLMVLNSGGSTAGLDAGIQSRRFQVPNELGTGDIVSGRIQENGVIGTGSTGNTIVLGATASTVDSKYVGWWIKVNSTTVRRVKTYVGSTKTITVYATADNAAATSTTSAFADGLDVVTVPTSGQAYQLFSESFSNDYYSNANNARYFATSANDSEYGTLTTLSTQQYTPVQAGKLVSNPLTFDNQIVTASGTTITLTSAGALATAVGRLIRITASSGTSPAIPVNNYTVTSVSSNTLTFTVPASTTATNAYVSVTFLDSSAVYANYIFPQDASLTRTILSGYVFPVTETIVIAKNSLTPVTITSTATSGIYSMIIQDTSPGGASISCTAAGNGVSANKVVPSARSDGLVNQKLDVNWPTGAKMTLEHKSIGSGTTGNYTYLVIFLTGN